MEIAAIRRARLRAYIDEHHGGNVSQFAARLNLSQSQMAETLRGGKKSFGEKLARKIEALTGLPAMSLDAPGEGIGAIALISGSSAEPAGRAPSWVQLQGVLSMDGDGWCDRSKVQPINAQVQWVLDGDSSGVEAWRIYGDSMAPKYQPGTVLLVSFTITPEALEECFIETVDGRITVAEFAAMRDGTLTVRRFADRTLMTLQLQDVKRIGHVAAAVGGRHLRVL